MPGTANPMPCAFDGAGAKKITAAAAPSKISNFFMTISPFQPLRERVAGNKGSPTKKSIRDERSTECLLGSETLLIHADTPEPMGRCPARGETQSAKNKVPRLRSLLRGWRPGFGQIDDPHDSNVIRRPAQVELTGYVVVGPGMRRAGAAIHADRETICFDGRRVGGAGTKSCLRSGLRCNWRQKDRQTCCKGHRKGGGRDRLR